MLVDNLQKTGESGQECGPDGTHAGTERGGSSVAAAVRQVHAYLAADPALRRRYARAKALRRVARYANNYDITSRCNLFCEGCFYFEGDDYKRAREETDLAKWQALYRSEAERGVTFANFVGAEPSLEPKRIAAAQKYFKRGVVFSNGTVKLDPAIAYTVLISVWGDEKTTTVLRGGSVLHKALCNYRGDSRARALFTVSAKNIDQIAAVTRIVADYGIPLSYNYFSPTDSYLRKLKGDVSDPSRSFRLSSADDNMILSSDDLRRIRDRIDDMIDLYPGLVFHSHAFNKFVTNPDGIYAIDPATGLAKNCSGMHSPWHQTHRVDLRLSDGKCCAPNTNCRHCRLSSISLASFMFRLDDFLASSADFVSWLDICDQWGRGHLLDTDAIFAGNLKAEPVAETGMALRRVG